jgi:hypothetical protein
MKICNIGFRQGFTESPVNGGIIQHDESCMLYLGGDVAMGLFFVGCLDPSRQAASSEMAEFV